MAKVRPSSMYGDDLGEDDVKMGDSLVHSLMVFVSTVLIILTFPVSCFVCLQVSLRKSARVLWMMMLTGYSRV
jgi:hypothetical protein